MQEKPEVTAWIRSQYLPDSLPDWLGYLESGDPSAEEEDTTLEGPTQVPTQGLTAMED